MFRDPILFWCSTVPFNKPSPPTRYSSEVMFRRNNRDPVEKLQNGLSKIVIQGKPVLKPLEILFNQAFGTQLNRTIYGGCRFTADFVSWIAPNLYRSLQILALVRCAANSSIKLHFSSRLYSNSILNMSGVAGLVSDKFSFCHQCRNIRWR